MRFAEVSANGAKAREDTHHIAVKNGFFFIVCNAQNRRGGVVSYAGQAESIIEAGWKLAFVFRDDLLRSLLQIARAAVITETGPQAQHFFLWSVGERVNIRES